MPTARKSRGRQKIEMKKMSNESNLQVTFSKRRSGLFKKASELCTLCGTDVALIVFSPGEKAFSFGHPNVDTIIDRYLVRPPPQNSGTMQFIEAHRTATVCELNAQLTQVNNQLDAEKKRGDELNRLHKVAMAGFWWALPIEDMSKAQLDQLRVALEELKKSLTRHAAGRLHNQGAVANPAQFIDASSSNIVVHHQPPPPPPPAQVPQLLFAPQILQPVMLHQNPLMQNHMFDMMRHHGFNINNMGGFGTVTGFF